MKTCVCTLNYGYETYPLYKFFRTYFIPTIKNYSERINSDFVLLDDSGSKYYGTWNQLKCFDLLEKYDRVLYFDGDCFIPKNFNINFFDKVEYGKIGTEISNQNNSICRYAFFVMLIDRENKKYFSNFNVSLEKQKELNNKNINNYCNTKKYYPQHKCFFTKEECYVNQIIVNNNLHNKIVDLGNYFTFHTYNNYSIFHVSAQTLSSQNKTDGGAMLEFFFKLKLYEEKNSKKIINELKKYIQK